MMLVTLEEAKAELHIIHDADDMSLTQKVESASAAVMTYLKADAVEGIPARTMDAARQATLLLVREFYDAHDGERMEDVGDAFGYGYLPRPVVALLYPHRDPSFA